VPQAAWNAGHFSASGEWGLTVQKTTVLEDDPLRHLEHKNNKNIA